MLEQKNLVMVNLKDLRRIIDLVDKKLISESEAIVLVKNAVIGKEEDLIIAPGSNLIPITSASLTAKKWMLKNIKKVNESENCNDIINKLKDSTYCNKHFNCDDGMAVLVSKSELPPMYVSRTGTKLERYFKMSFSVNGNSYWVYSNWQTESGFKNRRLFDEWFIESVILNDLNV